MGFLTLETKELKKTEKRDQGGGQTKEHYYEFYIKALVNEHNRKYSKAPQRETFFRSTLLRFSSVLLYCESLIACSCVCVRECARKKDCRAATMCVALFCFFLLHRSPQCSEVVFRGVSQKTC